MKKYFLFLMLLVLIIPRINAQLTGNKYIGTTVPPPDYATITAAVTDLNANGVGSGGVTFNIAAGYAETIISRIDLTATGTSSNRIIFQKYGSGNNPVITAYTGTATPSSATPDGIWSFTGCDYVTIDGIDLNDPNSTNPATMEYGYGLFKTSGTDGSQNNIIRNCRVNLSRNNNSTGNAPMLDGSVCILVINANPSAATTDIIVTAASGANSNNQFFSNTLQNCNIGLGLSGFAATGPGSNGDNANNAGGSSLATGNYIYNFGGGTSSANTAVGIKAVNQFGINISYNFLDNNNGTGGNHAATIRGVYITGGTNASSTINNNTILLTSGSSNTSKLSGVENISGSSGSGNTININYNTINLDYPNVNKGDIHGIYNNSAAPSTLNITNNNIELSTAADSGFVSAIRNSGSVISSVNISNNMLSSVVLTRSATGADVVYIYNQNAANTSAVNIIDNEIEGLEYTGTNPATGDFDGIKVTGSPLNEIIRGNVFDDLTFKKSGEANLIDNSTSVPSNGSKIVDNNSVGSDGISTSSTLNSLICVSDNGSGPTTISSNNLSHMNVTVDVFYGYYVNGSHPSFNIYNNIFSDITKTGGSIMTMMGVHGFAGTSAAPNTIHDNQIYNITSSSGDFGGIAANNTVYLDIYNNTVHDITLTCPGAACNGFWFKSMNGTIRAYRNSVYNILATNTFATVAGMKTGDNENVYIYNNFIHHLQATASSDFPAVMGIYNLNATNAFIYDNTIFLDGTSSATGFGTAGINSSINGNLTLRNNLVVNLCTPVGTGKAVAFRRESTNLTNYQTISNDNCFYAGTPGTSHLIYLEGSASNPKQTMAAYQAYMTPRETRSFSELPPFVNTSTPPYDLHLQPNFPTQCESSGHNITSPFTITNDYDGNIRFGNTGYAGTGTKTDIGADEWEGVPRDSIPPSITFSPLPNAYTTAARTLTATLSDTWGMPQNGSGLPVLYWKKNSGSWTAVTGTWVSGSTYTFTFGAGGTTGDVISYYICAQDNAFTPNVTCSPLAGASGFTSGPPACSTPPTTPASYTIQPLTTGNYRVGGTGTIPCPTCTFVDLTEAFSVLNTETVNGAITLILTSFYNSSEENAFPVVLNQLNGVSNTNKIKIIPDAGVTTTISGSSPNNAILKFNSSSYITIDGSNNGTSTRDLSITNTSATSPVVVWMGSSGTTPLSNLILKNCTITNGANTAPAVVISDNSAAGNPGYFNQISISGNLIRNASRGIWANGGASANGSNLTVSSNDLSQTGANAIGNTGICVEGVNNGGIYLNTIGNFNSYADENDEGILIGTGSRNLDIYRNQISGLGYSGSGNFASHGIRISSGVTSAVIRVYNNVIFDITGPGADYMTSLINNPCGICLSGTQDDVRLYFNSINLYGNTINRNNAMSMGICLGTGSSATIRNNMIVNNLGLSASSGVGATGLYTSSGTQLTALDFDNYYVNPSGNGSKNIGFIQNTGYATISAWKTATGKEPSGQNMDPLFNSNSDLRFQNNSLFEKGLWLTITNDFDGNTRHDPPDIGAFEVNLKIWNGIISTDWTNPANWTPTGVPTQYHNIIIPAPTPFTCNANTAGLHCKDLQINTGSRVNVPAGNDITVYGNTTIQN